jgi:DNA-directed RNA polymerase I, II, and III subunit RPABC2
MNTSAIKLKEIPEEEEKEEEEEEEESTGSVSSAGEEEEEDDVAESSDGESVGAESTEEEEEEDDDDAEEEEDEEGEGTFQIPATEELGKTKGKPTAKKSVKIAKTGKNANPEYLLNELPVPPSAMEEDGDDEYEEDPNYLKKFDDSLRKNIIAEYYPEMMMKNSDEIETLSKVVRDKNGNIIDPYHKTMPFITKYEKARVLGERANQINEGSAIFVKVEPDVIDGYLIALKEFEEKKIPFILQRPLPNGTCEYWRLADLEYL